MSGEVSGEPDDRKAAPLLDAGSSDLPEGPDTATSEEENAGSNPLGEQLDFSLSVPTIEVRMVNAAVLEEYEIWVLASSLLSSAAIGFLVAYLQSFHETGDGTQASDGSYLAVAAIFFLLLGLSLWRAVQLRRRVTSESKTYKMKASASSIVKQIDG